MSRRRVHLVMVLAVAAALLGCQLKDSEPPPTTGPSEGTTETGNSGAVLGGPTRPEPTPSPESETPETPSETPETPAASPPPTSGSCSLPASNPASPVCTDASPLLESEVEAALDAVTDAFPEIFDFADAKCENCYLVRDPDRYFDAVIQQLNRQGLCTDGVREELGVKSSNDFSEQYDILLSTGHMRRAPSAYRGVCRPAVF